MANKVQLKKSSVAARVPLTTDVDYGELALNYADGKLYYKKSDGTTIDYFPSVGYVPLLSGSYANPTWITSLDSSKLTGTIDNARLNGGTYSINITGNAGSASAVAWTGVTGKPTTLSGYGITDAYSSSNPAGYITSSFSGFMLRSTSPQTNPNTVFTSSAYRFDPSANNPTNEHYAIVTYGNEGNVTGQLATHFQSGQTFVRAFNASWSAWRTLLDSSNYTSYAQPTLVSGTNIKTVNGNSLLGSGNITVSATNADYATTSGSVSGLTLTSSANGINPDNVTQNQIGYNTSVSLFGQTDGGLYSSAYSSSWVHQIYGDFRTGQIAVRGKNSGTWQAWRTVLDSGNYSSYSNFGGNSVYAGIYYDGNDTGYYIDPTSTGTSYRGRGEIFLGPNTSSQYLRLGGNGGATDHSTVSTSNGNLHIDAKSGNNLYLAWYNGSDVMVGGGIQSTIYYDRGNTGYYCDPNSTSSLSYVYANRIILDRNYGHSIFGTYASTRYQGVWSMGQSWALPDDGTTTGNLYGLAWSHPNAGGTAGNLNTHGLLVLENGGFLAALSGSIRCRDDMRTPIYYDSNNTGYYMDANNTSRMNAINADSLYSYGNVTAYSDENLKTDWEDLPQDYIEQLAKVKSGKYTRIDTKERQAGVGARSFKNILPEVVIKNGDYLGVNYGNAALVSAIELAKRVVEQNNRIARLEELISKLIDN